MKTKIKQMIAFVVVIGLIVICGWSGTNYLKKHGRKETLEENELKLVFMSNYIADKFEKVEQASLLLSSEKDLVMFLEGNNKSIEKVNSLVDRYKNTFNIAAAYVMNMNGDVVASSNRALPESFVGKNYSFRPYFSQAVKGKKAEYLAKGLTSGKKGFYVGCPLRNDEGDIVGVSVLKKDMATVEKVISEHKHCYFANDKGVVLLSSNKKQDASLLYPRKVSEDEKEKIFMQFGSMKEETIFSTKPEHGQNILLGDETFLVIEKQIPNKKWKIVLLASRENIMMYVSFGIVLSLLFIAISVFFFIVVWTTNKTKRAIKAEKELTDMIFEVTPSGVFTVDREQRVVRWNKKCEEITGYSAEEIRGKHCSVFAKKPCNDECIVFSKNNGEPIIGTECALVTKDGHPKIISKNADLLRDKNGEVFGAIESFTDITEKKEKDQKILQLSEAVEQSSSSIIITDIKGDIIYANPAFSVVTGYSFEEVAGKNPRVLKSDYLPEEVYKELWETITTGDTWRGEFHNKRKDETMFWEKAIITPVKDGFGEITNFIAIKDDITKTKADESLLKENAERLDMALNAINEGLWDFRPIDNVLYFSPVWFTMLGYEPYEMPTSYKTWKNLLHPDDIAPTEKALKSFLEKKTDVFDVEFRMREKNGNWRWINSRARSFEIEKGRISRMVGTHRDIHDRKMAEQEKEKALKIKTQFTSMISHELRTPLAVIKGNIDLLMDGFVGEITDKQEDLMERARRNVERLNRLINDVLDFQKLDEGMMSFDFQERDIAGILKDVSENIKHLVESSGLFLKCEVSENLPSIHIDQDRIVQVLMNLLNNALKFTEKGEIGIKAFNEQNLLHVVIWDTGPGVKDEDKEKLFDSFHQLDTTKEKKIQGTGLGLSISKEIINRHHGKIWVESVFGQGSQFHFVLPTTEPPSKNNKV